MSDSDSEYKSDVEEEVTDLTNSDVVSKYKMAAQFVNTALKGVVTKAEPGAKVVTLCALGDTLIDRQCDTAFKKNRGMEKGVAFPTCISVNSIVCHYSPLASEDSIELKEGDCLKIDMGCHLDGFIAVVAHTCVVGGAAAVADEKQANVIAAAHTAAELAIRTIKPGNTNAQVTELVARVAEHFGVERVQGTLSHQMKQFVIDGNDVIIQKETPESKVDEVTFEAAQVWAMDVCFSTGDGTPRDTDFRTTVFKRAVDVSYSLKMKASRAMLGEVNRKFAVLPFTLRALEDEKAAKMGVVECVKHDLLHAYPVLTERDDAHVAHFKFTILLLPGGTTKITGLELPEGAASAKIDELPEDLKALLATKAASSKSKRKKKNKAKRAAEAAGAGAGAGAGSGAGAGAGAGAAPPS